MKSYQIPVGEQATVTLVKKSEFICYLAHTPNRDAAHAFIQKIREKHPDANHNCWAYVAGKPEDPACWGMNDDGEPKGCAGKPMFNVLNHSGIGEICAVVSRYFGGIKLGTGGMARAYSGAVSDGLSQLETTVKHHYKNYSLQVPYPLLQTVEKILVESKSITLASDYGAQVGLDVQLRADLLETTLPQLLFFEHQGLGIVERGEKE